MPFALFAQGLVGAVGAGAGAVGNGVLRTGERLDDDRLRAKPVLGQISKRAVMLRNTLLPFTVPRDNRSVLAAPAPLSIDRKV
jgi:hypothetical protein